MNYRCIFILLSILLVPGPAESSAPPNGSSRNSISDPGDIRFERLSVKNGLSDNSVNCILQDREGFMWFGTSDGLNRYDGTTFTTFQQDPNNPTHSLYSNFITSLYEDHAGRLWVTSRSGPFIGRGGLHLIDKRTGTVTPIPIQVPTDDWKQVLSVYEDRQGMIWACTLGGLIRYDHQYKQYKLYSLPAPNASLITVLEDKQGRFWVGSIRGLYSFDRESGQFTLIPAQGQPQPWVNTVYQDRSGRLWATSNGKGLLRIVQNGTSFSIVPYTGKSAVSRHILKQALHEDASGQLWLGTTEGLLAIDPGTNQVRTYRADSPLASGLASNRIQAVYRDRAGTLWIGTDQGIHKQDGALALFSTIQIVSASPTDIQPANNVSALWQDRGGVIWIGADNRILYRYNPQTGEMKAIPTDLANPANPAAEHHVQTVYQDRSGQLWVSTVSALLKMDRQTGTFVRYPNRIRQVQALTEDATGALWLAGKGGVARFIPKTATFMYYDYDVESDGKGFVLDIMLSRTGDLWLAVNGKGISRLDPRTGRRTNIYPNLPTQPGQLNDNQVTDFYEDRDGTVWVGTDKGGLNRYDPATGLFTALTTQHGLPSNHVSAIVNDQRGHLWISTSRGICRFNKVTGTFHTYTTEDGLPQNQFLSKVSYGLRGDLLFGSLNGVVIVHPDQIYNESAFPVYITRFNVLDHSHSLTDKPVVLKHDENFISFDFVALSYRTPEKNQYAYQLDGADEHWVYCGTRHFANYATLAPGNYTFRVKAANGDGIWSEQSATLTLIIQPPWWATWWAYCLYVLLLAASLLLLFRFYMNRVRQRQELEFNRREAEQLKAVDELKTRFFSNITHEFRTPLSLIIGPVEKLLNENRFDRAALTLVHRNAGQLLRLINQLLDLSKLEGNYMPVSLRQGSVIDFVDYIVAVFQRAAAQRGISLTWSAERVPRHEFVFDADKWEKILTNLLSNALKFTPNGGQITLSVKPAGADEPLSEVSIELTDSGIGIAPDQLPYVFDRFYQADTSSTRAYEGTGIGLALAKELVELLGGMIDVESTLGAGTTFRLRLPVQAVSPMLDVPTIIWTVPEPSVVASPVVMTPVPVPNLPEEQPSSSCILIVEDNDELREFLVGELASSYQLLQAKDGAEGWAIVQAELPDLVLTDVMMPLTNGYELTSRIKSQAETDHIAVIMLTAKSAQQSRIEGLQQGADDYLTKPFSIEELKLRLHNLFTRQQRLGERYRQRFSLPEPVSYPTTDPVQDPFLQRIYTLLDAHLDDSTISVDWLAEQLKINRRTLHRKLQSLIQLAPGDLIRQYRLRRAAELLNNGSSVSDTAYLVGFNTPSHFTQAFREFYQQTPTQFMAGRVIN